MGDIRIEALIQGHDPPHRAHGDIGTLEETPHPEAASIGVVFLELIDLLHQREPHFAGMDFRGAAFVHQAHHVFRFTALDPGMDRRTRDMQDPTDALFGPPLRLASDHLQPGVRTVRVAVVVIEREFALRRWGALFPEMFDRLNRDAVSTGMPDHPDYFAVVKVRIEGFEPGHLLHDRCWDLPAWMTGSCVRPPRQEPEHPLVAEATRECTDGIGMRPSFLRPLGRCSRWQED